MHGCETNIMGILVCNDKEPYCAALDNENINLKFLEEELRTKDNEYLLSLMRDDQEQTILRRCAIRNLITATAKEILAERQ